MKKINLSITGCLGRMGKQLIKSSKKSRDYKIVSITENKKINKKIFGLRPSLNSKDTFKKTKATYNNDRSSRSHLYYKIKLVVEIDGIQKEHKIII